MNFSLLIPELTAVGVLVLLLMKELAAGPRSSSPQLTSWFTALGGVGLVLASLFWMTGKPGAGFNGTFVLDPLALFFKFFFTAIVFFVIFISREYFKGRAENASEFLMILWSSLLGLFFLASANDFLLMFVALETFTLSLYILTAYAKREMSSIEAGLKYLVLGSLASAFIIFGVGLLFVATGSTSFLVIRDAFAAEPSSRLVLTGFLLVIAGLGFKIASVPFQLWAPDVYEGAPTPVVAYLSTASKAAGFLLLLRLLFTVFPDLEEKRGLLFSALAAMTLLYGNLGALVQTHIKRLFGYSSISHAGYLMIGLAVGTELGATSILYYLLVYAMGNLAAFMVIAVVGRQIGSDRIPTYAGLGKRAPFLAGVMFLSLLSLAGVPPLGGFFGKFMILLTAVRGNYAGLALLGSLLVAVSLYYYLNLVRVMYFDPASEETPLAVPGSCKLILILLSAGMIVAGLWQAPFFAAALQAAKSLF
jgi:NADH-quinone oxidoreductase subunit N